MGNMQDTPDRFQLDGGLRDMLADFDNKDVIANEAEFGFRYVSSYLDRLGEGSSVLEVGSGPCILLSHIKHHYPQLDVGGIEPVGPGFSKFRAALERLQERYGFQLFFGGYEDYESDKKADVIFLINVFEHFPSWKDFLGFVEAHLKPDGVCVILCPNYGFPYESHFRLPIIFSKKLTYRIFKEQILKSEEKRGAHGLWKSLNFVTLRQVEREMKNTALDMTMRTSILDDMIDRLETDEEFYKRQKVLGSIARVFKRIGLLKLIKSRALRHFQPYMFLELRLKKNSET